MSVSGVCVKQRRPELRQQPGIQGTLRAQRSRYSLYRRHRCRCFARFARSVQPRRRRRARCSPEVGYPQDRETRLVSSTFGLPVPARDKRLTHPEGRSASAQRPPIPRRCAPGNLRRPTAFPAAHLPTPQRSSIRSGGSGRKQTFGSDAFESGGVSLKSRRGTSISERHDAWSGKIRQIGLTRFCHARSPRREIDRALRI